MPVAPRAKTRPSCITGVARGPSPPKRSLNRAYSKLRNKFVARINAPGVLYMMSFGGDLSVDPIRVVGNHNKTRHPAFPRMHNKFLVAGDVGEVCTDEPDYQFRPRKVWTGSYNFTKNAGMSFENGVVIHHEPTTAAFTREWSQIAAFSEPLSWHEDWCAPEWRIGS